MSGLTVILGENHVMGFYQTHPMWEYAGSVTVMRWIYVTAAMGLLLSSIPAVELHARDSRLPQSQNKDRRAPMTQILERKQVPAEHQWNLEDLFAD